MHLFCIFLWTLLFVLLLSLPLLLLCLSIKKKPLYNTWIQNITPPTTTQQIQHNLHVCNRTVPYAIPTRTPYPAVLDSTNAEKSNSKNLRRPQNLPMITEDMVKSPSSQSMARQTSGTELAEQQHKGNTHFMRKIPPGAEASNILVGEVDFLERTLSCFIRLSQAAVMGDLTEVPVPTR